MKRVPRGFVPPPRKPGQPVAGLYTEPQEEMLLLGEMLYDAQTMSELLGALRFEKDGYRANLRIVRGAAVRMADRCARLLGEVANATQDSSIGQVSAALDDTAPETSGVTDGEPRSVQQPEGDVQADRGKLRGRPSLNNHGQAGSLPAAPVGNQRKRSTAVPIAGGVKAAIIRTLQFRGPMTATDLVEELTKDSGVNGDTVHETLAKMRVAKEVLHNRVMGRIYNRLA